jgi:hypothetical protein
MRRREFNPIIVQKYGGACLETPAKIRAVASSLAGPMLRACFESGSELPTARIAPSFSDWAIFLRTSGLLALGTVLENSLFQAICNAQRKRGRGLTLG